VIPTTAGVPRHQLVVCGGLPELRRFASFPSNPNQKGVPNESAMNVRVHPPIVRMASRALPKLARAGSPVALSQPIGSPSSCTWAILSATDSSLAQGWSVPFVA
jgi:hypothetical protein